MRKHLSLSLVLLGMATLAQAVSSGNYRNKTFLTVRPEGQTSSPEKFSGGWTIPSECMEDGCWFFGGEGRFQGVVFGGWSTKREDTGEYFSLAQRNNLLETTAIMTVTGGVSGAAGTVGSLGTSITGDINPVSLGLVFGSPIVTLAGGSYASTLTFNPRRSVVGGLFDWKQYVGWWCDEPRFWFEVSFPVERVRTTMGATEDGIVRTGTPFAAGTATSTVLGILSGTQPVIFPAIAGGGAVLNLGTFAHGLVTTGTISRTGVADVEVKLGMDYIRDECCHLDGYFGFVAPTGTRPTGVYMFEPVVGNNHHWGIMTGGSYGCAFWHGCSDNSLRWEFETNFRYLFRNSQVRTFDLVDRPGSRYLPFYASAAAAGTGTLTLGMEVLTQAVHVKPHSQFSMTNALVYQHCGFFAEIGWNVFAREQESIRPIDETAFLTNGATSIFAVADLGAYLAAIGGAAPASVNLLSNIGNINDGGIVAATLAGAALTVADVDFQSAASPAAFVNSVFGDIGYKFDWCWPIYVGVGGSYAFSANNGELNRWLAWGKFGIAF